MHADDGPLLPVAPFLAIVEQAALELGGIERVGPAMGHPSIERRASDWRRGRVVRVSFRLADQIVTHLIGPQAWHERPELRALYE